MLRLPPPDPRILKQETKAGVNEPAVPRDRLLKPRFRFPEIGRAKVFQALDLAHRLSEAEYSGDGRWDALSGYHDLVRDRALRVTGYLSAYRATGSELYLDRATAGLDNLLFLQLPDGGFPDYKHSFRGVHGTGDALIDTALAGLALLHGHAQTNDDRLLEASRRAAHRETKPHVGESVTASATAAAHLAAHSEAALDESFFGQAIDRACSRVLPAQLPSGGWPGEDSWIWNHGLITLGLARLVRATSLNHARRPELMAALVGAINRMLREQTALGDIPANPRVKLRSHSQGNAIRAMLAARDLTNASLDSCLRGMMGYWLSKLPSEESMGQYELAWRAFRDARSSVPTPGGDVLWRADLSRFVRDVEWGEVAAGAISCCPSGHAFDPGHQRWARVTSGRTAANAQRITSQGAALVGGVGWDIPAGVLPAGRLCVFRASVSCEGSVASVPFLVGSVALRQPSRNADPLTIGMFTRESPTFGSYSTISTTFTVSRGTHRVCIWAAGEPIEPGESVSVTVDEAFIEDAGPRPNEWLPPDLPDREPLLTAAACLESLAHSYK